MNRSSVLILTKTNAYRLQKQLSSLLPIFSYHLLGDRYGNAESFQIRRYTDKMKRNERKKKGKKMLFPSSGTTQYLSLGRLEKVISFIGEQNSKTTIHAFPFLRATIINYKSSQERS